MAQIQNFGFMPLFQKSQHSGWVIPDYSQCYYTGQEGIYVVWYQGWTEPIRWDVIPEL